ncbi:MAG: tRNA pseudouridine(54/55) synthase Pus10 [Candidatus Methanoliparum thermophilum]|uniref:tRNA pseudouridine synthase Pus10 n=1 Tax=Methanoliparum thermophilum TaxID=2491083 RepID=A0A520KS64_METT2|nr:tRNA pseudouridine(54/55) synthase Pus10 [Candidatus Methanoliparum sp. LAM-1]RZN64622.1 MAG: tRNA pseudouridine(54/55) synthase Pus10 [Candidatus Methanoliparum thermophilum]BDC35754.1 tRNA pseudouridine(54/55) synthase Pus10 [Candidatus Methanoliparum sp. LAM-1]
MDKDEHIYQDEIIKISEKVINDGYVCNRCLGRQFVNLWGNIGNEERGRRIKNILRDYYKIDHISNVCWICGGFLDDLDEWVRRCIDISKDYEYDTFLVGTHISGLLHETEEYLWEKTGARYTESIKAEINREIGKRIEKVTGKNVDFVKPDILFLIDIPLDKVTIKVKPVYIYGRYKKYVRDIPQTKWPCRACGGVGCYVCNYTGKKYLESVEELIGKHALKSFLGEFTKFHGAGREDIDVRMLGNGRPFVLEIINPKKRFLDLTQIENDINKYEKDKIEVSNIRFADKEEISYLKSLKVDKIYKCDVTFDRILDKKDIIKAIGSMNGVILKQRTPTRVLHRRKDLIRERRVNWIKLVDYTGDSAVLEISCEGGTYVKELITGDYGRTIPNLSDLLDVTATVKTLDVISFK